MNKEKDEYIKQHRNKVEPFKFNYTVPCLDWFDTISVVINYDDYYYFKLEKRYGPSWWLIGLNSFDKPNYHWKETSIGNIKDTDLKRFIEWARSLENNGGNPIIGIKAISGSFDIFKEIKELEK